MITVNILTRQFPANQQMPRGFKNYLDVSLSKKHVASLLQQRSDIDLIDIPFLSCYFLPCDVFMVWPESIEACIGLNGINNNWHSEQFSNLKDVDVLTIIDFDVENDTSSSIDLKPFSVFAVGSRSESLLACLMAGFANLRKNDINYDNLIFKDNTGAHIGSHYLSNLKKWQANNWCSETGERLKYADALQKMYRIMYDDMYEHINTILDKEINNLCYDENRPIPAEVKKLLYETKNDIGSNNQHTLQQEEQKNLEILHSLKYLQFLHKLQKEIDVYKQLPTEKQQKLLDLLEQVNEILFESKSKQE